MKADETLLLFPTLGSQEDDGWLIDVHGWVFEPETSQVIEPLLRRGLELKEDQLTAEERKLWSQRLALFLADSERGKSVPIEVNGQNHLLGPSEPNGHVHGRFKLPWANAPDFAAAPASKGGPLPLRAYLDTSKQRTVDGAILLVPRQGISIVSDIDDTIKISQVRDRHALIQNTFLRPFRPVPGMAALYRQWQTNAGIAFHYVSASPWQMFRALDMFLRSEKFPEGSVHLQSVRIKDGSFVELFGAHDDHKLAVLDGLMERYPERVFVLVGDSGERDPEIYGETARRYPARVGMVWIRDVTGEGRESARYGAAFRAVARERWRLFGDGTELLGEKLGGIGRKNTE